MEKKEKKERKREKERNKERERQKERGTKGGRMKEKKEKKERKREKESNREKERARARARERALPQARIQDFLQGGQQRPCTAGAFGARADGGSRVDKHQIKVHSVHRIFRAIFFLLVKKFVEKKNWWSRAGGSRPPPPRIRACTPTHPNALIYISIYLAG